MNAEEPKPLSEDPVVEEVRAVRARLWKEAGGTVEGLMRLIASDQPENETKPGTHGAKTPTRD